MMTSEDDKVPEGEELRTVAEQDGDEEQNAENTDGAVKMGPAPKNAFTSGFKKFQKNLKKSSKKTADQFRQLGQNITDGITSIKTRAGSTSATPATRSRTSSRASSLQRNMKLMNMKEVFDNFGKRMSLGRGQALNMDEVFMEDAMAEQLDDALYNENFDWGESWPSFEAFEQSLANLKEKSNGFAMLIQDICDAESKYAKKMRTLASNHLTAYQRTHSKITDQPHAEYSKHQAMKQLLTTANRLADHHELASWSLNTFLENEFKTKLSDASDKLHGITSAHKKLKKDLAFQLGRVKSAKNEYNKRVAQLEQSEQNYQKYQDDHADGTGDIKEQDKLRVQVADKSALVTRAQEEHDNQVVAFNALQKQCYTEDLPALCRSQKEIHQFLTEQWAAALQEYSEKNHTKLSANVEEFNKLDGVDAIGGVNKMLDASILYKNTVQDNTLPAELNTIADIEEFKFPTAPPRSPVKADNAGVPVPRARKLSEAVCLLNDSEKSERIKQLEKADDFIVLKDGRVFKVGVVTEDFEEDYKGAMSITQGTYVGVTRAEAIKHKTEYNDGWIKVTNLETEAVGYIPVAYMQFNSGQSL